MWDQLQPWMTAIYAAAAIAALIIIALIAVRLLSGHVRGRKGSRLGISEYYEIDKSRRLVLIRRDDVEHLLLIGGGQDVVIEDSIGSPLLSNTVAAAPPPRQAPRAPVFAARRPTLRTVENPPPQGFDDPGEAR